MSKISNEIKYHNDRYASDPGRKAQAKYYVAVSAAKDAYIASVIEKSNGGRVLELGCGVESLYNIIAKSTKSYVAIDISPVAVDIARTTFNNDISFFQMDAENLMFKDSSFDTIFGSGIVHHLDICCSIDGIHRCLSDSGTAIFFEPLGFNPLINLYRFCTPKSRSPDEHPLLTKDLNYIRLRFSDVKITYYGFFTLLLVWFPKSQLFTKLCRTIDDIILNKFRLKYFAWVCLICARK